jgi:CheY-like chemotaxis protein
MQVFPPYSQTILLVSDSQQSQDIVSQALSPFYKVCVANGHELASFIHDMNPPDLLLLDTAYPGRGGQELCRQLKQLALPRELPTIFLDQGNYL